MQMESKSTFGKRALLEKFSILFHETRCGGTQPLSFDHTDLSVLTGWLVGQVVGQSVCQLVTLFFSDIFGVFSLLPLPKYIACNPT